MANARFCSNCGFHLAATSALSGARPDALSENGELRARADSGDPEAIKDVGLRYERAGDDETARQWFNRAAELGHVGAMRNLGVLRVKAGDPQGALAWFTKATDADDGSVMSRNSITDKSMVAVAARAASQAALELFKLGRGGECEEWIARSQKMGDDQATVLIAVHLYEEGDLTRALDWAIRASDEGELRGTALVVSILAQQYRMMEMAPYLAKILQLDAGFEALSKDSLAVLAQLLGDQFAAEGDSIASEQWLARARALQDPQTGGSPSGELSSNPGLGKKSDGGSLGSVFGKGL